MGCPPKLIKPDDPVEPDRNKKSRDTREGAGCVKINGLFSLDASIAIKKRMAENPKTPKLHLAGTALVEQDKWMSVLETEELRREWQTLIDRRDKLLAYAALQAKLSFGHD